MSTTPRKNRRQKTSILSKARWAGYAAAGAATVLGAHESANADFFWSGLLGVDGLGVPLDGTAGLVGDPQFAPYSIDLPGGGSADLVMMHKGSILGGKVVGSAYVLGPIGVGVGIAGLNVNGIYYASRLSLAAGDSVRTKAGNPRLFQSTGYMAARDGFPSSQFVIPAGTGYIGFAFDAGGGTRYGWLQVNMKGVEDNFAFSVIDYAYAGVDENIQAGQTFENPEPGSLGLLATGAVGLLLWRRKRRSSHPKA